MLNSLPPSRKVARHAGTVMLKKAFSRGPAGSRARRRPHSAPRSAESLSKVGSTAVIEQHAAPRLHAPFPIVGIGASAGGLEAFRQLLGALPADSGMAYVLVQHLDPRHESILAELLSEATKMQVSEVKGDMRVEPNRVYVIPPSKDMVIADGMLKLVPRRSAGRPHMPIDFPADPGRRAGQPGHRRRSCRARRSDGTLGLQAIKAEGGIAFAQDPASAKFHGMPRSAIAAGCVDFVLSPEDIAQELTRLGRHPYMAADEPRALQGAPPARRERGRGQGQPREDLRPAAKGRGTDFSAYKKTTLRRRIARRMAVSRIETLDDYAQRLEGDASEIRRCTRTASSRSRRSSAIPRSSRLSASRSSPYC